MSSSLLHQVGIAGGDLDHVDAVCFEAGAHFVLGPQRDELAAEDGSVGTHGVFGVWWWRVGRRRAGQSFPRRASNAPASTSSSRPHSVVHTSRPSKTDQSTSPAICVNIAVRDDEVCPGAVEAAMGGSLRGSEKSYADLPQTSPATTPANDHQGWPPHESSAGNH